MSRTIRQVYKRLKDMAEGQFKYDVAFSFLGKDEALAVQLNERLKDRLATFIYSDAGRQSLLAGRDGGESFSRVFGKEARTVVVLYRAGWGDTGFTAVEATAIRNRAHEFGFDFTTFIPLDKPPIVPQWLPRFRIWVGLDKWGVDHAATVIESRVQQTGGTPREETAADVAARTLREKGFAAERDALIHSPQGVEAARQAFEVLCGELKRICDDSSGLIINPERFPNSAAISGGKWRVLLSLDIEYTNTLRGSGLHVTRHDMARARDLAFRHARSGPDSETKYLFDVGPSMEHGWRKTGADQHPAIFTLRTNEGEFFTTTQLAEAEAKKLLGLIGADIQNRR